MAIINIFIIHSLQNHLVGGNGRFWTVENLIIFSWNTVYHSSWKYVLDDKSYLRFWFKIVFKN